jgi:hypothetical protein
MRKVLVFIFVAMSVMGVAQAFLELRRTRF